MRRAMWVLAMVLAMGILTARGDDGATEPAKVVGTVSGTVVDKDGNPLKGAMVLVMNAADFKDPKGKGPRGSQPSQPRPGQWPDPIAKGTTGDDGAFKIGDVPLGKVRVGAIVRGVGGWLSDVVEIKANEEAKLPAPITLSKTK